MSPVMNESVVRLPKRQQKTCKLQVVVDQDSPLSPRTSYWSRAIVFFVHYVLAADDYVDCSIQSPLLNESMITYSPQCPSRPPPKDIDQPSQAERVVSASSDFSIRSADIRMRDGKWMVSRDLETDESIFIQFPPLAEEENEDKSQSGDDGKVQAGWGVSSSKRNAPKKRGRVAQEKKDQDNDISTIGGSPKMITPLDNDNEKEWYPL